MQCLWRAFQASMIFQGDTDTNAFYTYVAQVLVPQLWTGACVVVVSVLTHFAGIKEAIEAVGAKLIYYLSAYSPDFSQP